MIVATSVKALLVTALAALSLWRVATPVAGTFALRASIVDSQLVVTLTLAALCVRLTTHLTDELADLDAFASCEGCAAQAAPRAWS